MCYTVKKQINIFTNAKNGGIFFLSRRFQSFETKLIRIYNYFIIRAMQYWVWRYKKNIAPDINKKQQKNGHIIEDFSNMMCLLLLQAFKKINKAHFLYLRKI